MPEKFDLANLLTDPDLERQLVAALASRPKLFWDIPDYLVPEVFVESRLDYEAVTAAIQEDRPLPMVDGTPAVDPLDAARRLFDLYQKRQVADLIGVTADRLRDNTPSGEIIDHLESELVCVSQKVKGAKANQAVALPDLLPPLQAEVASRRQALQDGRPVGLPTGISRLDKKLGGLQKGLHMLAAEPGAGKTSLCLQVGANVSRKGYPVIFVSFEEALDRLTLKVICQAAGLDAKRFADGYGDPDELRDAALEHGPGLVNLLLVEGTGQLTTGRLKSLALQAMHRASSDKCLLIIDYLQRWAGSLREAREFRHVVSNLVGELRELALRCDSPVLVVSSQNRQGQGEARLSSLKETSDLEYSADTVWFLVDGKGNATPPARSVNLKIAKNRYGDRGEVHLIYKPDIGVFREEEKAW